MSSPLDLSAGLEVGSPPPGSRLPGSSRRDRRKAETRQRILGAARQLFVERGYHATRPQDIARAADVAVGTFYLHFADKSAAFLAFTDEAASELMEAVRAAAPSGRGVSADPNRSGFSGHLRASLDTLLQYADDNPGVLRVAFADESVITEAKGPRLRDRLARSLAERLRDGIERGVIHDDADPWLVAYAIVGLIQEALVYGATHRVSRRALLDQVTRFCTRALVLEPPTSVEDSSS